MKKLTILFLMLYPLFSNGQRFDIADGEEIVFHSYFGDYYIFENTKKNTFFITDENEKTVIKNLKYCEPLSMDFIQTLDNRNNIIYYNKNLIVIKNFKIKLLYCSTIDSYNIKLLIKYN